jgi:hypothetical protein
MMVGQILTALGADEGTYEEIMQLTVGTEDPLWFAMTVPDQRRHLDAFVELEQKATEVVSVQPLLIPGLLQTGAYARTAIAGLRPPPDLSTRVAIRTGRQQVLSGTEDRQPVHLIAYIGEAALWNTIGSAEVMASQMRDLLTKSEFDNVDIHVLRRDAGWNPSVEGGFTLFLTGDTVPIVYVEIRNSGLFLYDDDDDEASEGRYRQAVTDINGVAADQDESRDIITRYLNDWESSR